MDQGQTRRGCYAGTSVETADGGADWAGPYADLVDEATCVADAIAAGCEYLDRADQAEEDGDEERAEVYRTDAEEEFEACDLLQDEFGIGG